MRNKGPIPKGDYKIGEDTGRQGKYSLVLTPDGHDALGRTELRIHGDHKKHPGKASTGCMILNPVQREAIWKSKEGKITDRISVVDEPAW